MGAQNITGKWKVEPESGRVPGGLSITVKEKGGWARLGGVPFGRFRIAGSTLEHRRLPLSEQLEYRDDGIWHGKMLWRGKELGRFRLQRIHA